MTISEYPAPRLHGTRPRWPRISDAVRELPAELWMLGALVAIAAAIRIITIDSQSLWTDEALTAFEARQPFGGMLNTVLHVETTPPLYFLVVWAWTHVFGGGGVGLRSLSSLAGIALVPITYLCGRELASPRTGVLAAAFVAINPYMVWYSQEARAYMLLTALCAASFLFFVRALRDPSRRNLTWWAIWSGLAVMTHFFGGFFVAPEALWLLWRARSARTAIAAGTVAIVQAAMLPFAFLDTSHGVTWIAQTPPLHRIGTGVLDWGLSNLFRRGTVAEGLISAAVLIVAVVLLVELGGDRHTRNAARAGSVIGGCVILAPLALSAVGQDYFIARNVIPAFVPLVTVIAAACLAPRARLLGGALAVVLLAVFSIATARVQSEKSLQRADWRAVAHALGPASVPRAVLSSGGVNADPLKIYLTGVDWTASRSRVFTIREVDVVGAKGRQPVLPEAPVDPGVRRGTMARPLPAFRAPRGAVLVTREKVASWWVARFRLLHPIRTTIDGLTATASRYYHRTPRALLVFVQPSREPS